jgi:murein DD-endopeptidase MepM/ murein hydrolase activator NlpD
MHRGVDFAAPTGTPIYAAGDGRLARVGRYGGYGNYVRIEHGNGYATAYAHLSRFAAGMRSGRRVEQGEVIGYVGSTGRSTGPHLHFEVLKNGEQVDPLDVAQPPAENLAGTALAAFRREVRAVETRLAELGSRTFAADRRREVASGG